MRGKTIPAIAMLALLIVAFTASAVTVEECIGLIEDTRAVLAGTDIIYGNEEQIRECLVSKLDDAIAKHNDGKYDCAVKQLENFIGRLDALFGAGKISEIDWYNLVGHANDAITSIEDSH